MTDESSIAQIFRPPDWTMALEVGAVLLIAAVLIVGSQRALPWLGNRLHGRRRLFVLALVPVLRLLIIVAAFIMIVPMVINPSVQNMVALLGTVGLAIGFALKDLASSLIAGVVAVGEMPYRNGDWIKIDGIYGEVRYVGMRTVQVVTPTDDVVSIPHSRLWNTPIYNSNDGSPRLQCVADFYLHPEHDAAEVKQVLSDVALSSAFLHFGQPIAVIVHEKPWGTWYRLKAYPVDARQQFRFVTDLTVRGKATLLGLGVSFATAPTTEIDAG
ncbi:MAG: mechanosensitive ion channel protein MscS [Azoarcus sp.]|nr:MAG: mechanosensitive ion channel protein MscS [Azoarcus sp.]TVT58966.1 MAG: mechanosensitive ion channel [Azoarcus sp. PHD]